MGRATIASMPSRRLTTSKRLFAVVFFFTKFMSKWKVRQCCQCHVNIFLSASMDVYVTVGQGAIVAVPFPKVASIKISNYLINLRPMNSKNKVEPEMIIIEEFSLYLYLTQP